MQEISTSSKTRRTPTHAPQRTPTFHATRRLILGYLACYPCLRAMDLAVALNRMVQLHHETPLDASNISRHLRHLAAEGVVEAVTDTRLAAPLWRLTRRGLAVVAQMSGEAAATLISLCKVTRPFMRRVMSGRANGLGRMVSIQRAVLGLCLHAPGGFAALDRGKRPGVAWHWMRAWQHRFLWRRQMITAHADAVILWQRTPRQYAGPVAFADSPTNATPVSQAPSNWHCAFVLLAAGQETPLNIRRSVERLVQYREATERLPVYGEFPPVLILLQHPHARERWREALSVVAQRERVPLLAGAMAVLPEGQTGIGDPWRLRWESLADGTRVMLAEVLGPLAREAWPAERLPGRLHGSRSRSLCPPRAG
jgi:DNA-binding MarR family transcriptional regulator